MRSLLNRHPAILAGVFVVLGFLGLGNLSAAPADSSPTPGSLRAAADIESMRGVSTNLEALTAAYIRLQADLKAAREAMEQGGRGSGDTEALRLAERLGLQLARLERELEVQKQEKQQMLRTVEASSHQNLLYASVFAGVALLAVMAMSFLQLRATAKLTDLALSTSGIQERVNLLTAGGSAPAAPATLGPANGGDRLLESMERLERRILELEGTTTVRPLARPDGPSGPLPALPSPSSPAT
ncbi:MAG TPA: hypothetical protein DCM86_17665, partial [Verrucomicrobiales bacterium]|nr:hypothetical protein [Verrucomicrobiales bacterium]